MSLLTLALKAGLLPNRKAWDKKKAPEGAWLDRACVSCGQRVVAFAVEAVGAPEEGEAVGPSRERGQEPAQAREPPWAAVGAYRAPAPG